MMLLALAPTADVALRQERASVTGTTLDVSPHLSRPLLWESGRHLALVDRSLINSATSLL